jgi:hypothetical protein
MSMALVVVEEDYAGLQSRISYARQTETARLRRLGSREYYTYKSYGGRFKPRRMLQVNKCPFHYRNVRFDQLVPNSSANANAG